MISMINSVRKIRFNSERKENRRQDVVGIHCTLSLFSSGSITKTKKRIRIKENEKRTSIRRNDRKSGVPNKGVVTVAEEGKSVIVKNGDSGTEGKILCE